MKVTNKLIRILLACCMAAQLVIPAFAAEEKPLYLALGDSISSGYGLSAPETESFVAQIAASDKYAGYELNNRAVSGYTAEDIYNQLTDPTNPDYVSEELLAGADLITITCGGNDVMDHMYDVLLKAYNEADPPPSVPIRDKDHLMEIVVNDMDTAIGVLRSSMDLLSADFVNTAGVQNAIHAFEASLTKLMGYIRSKNETAEVIIATQYHPYLSFTHTYVKHILAAITPCLALTPEASSVCSHITAKYGCGCGAGHTAANLSQCPTPKAVEYSYTHTAQTCSAPVPLVTLNSVIVDHAKSLGYAFADVHTAFSEQDPKGKDFCNAKFSLAKREMEFDFHPTAAGHTAIAETFLAVEHNLGAGKVIAPTCSERGYTAYPCTDCGYVHKADYVPTIPHTEAVDAAVPSTCSATGLTEGKHCSVCQEVLVKQEVTPALGHNWTTKEETDGIRKECTRCDASSLETKNYEVTLDTQTQKVQFELPERPETLWIYAAYYDANQRLAEVKLISVTDDNPEVTFQRVLQSGTVKAFFISDSSSLIPWLNINAAELSIP